MSAVLASSETTASHLAPYRAGVCSSLDRLAIAVHEATMTPVAAARPTSAAATLTPLRFRGHAMPRPAHRDGRQAGAWSQSSGRSGVP